MKLISIYDHDLNNYLVEGLPEELAYERYLGFRGDEAMGEWWTMNEDMAPIFHKIFSVLTDEDFDKMYNSLYDLWVSEIITTDEGKKYIKEDIDACNFEVIDTTKYYQPDLPDELWGTPEGLWTFDVYHSKEKAQADFPDYEIKEYSGDDIEDPTFVDHDRYDLHN